MNKFRELLDKPITWRNYLDLCKWATIIYAALYGVIWLWYEIKYCELYHKAQKAIENVRKKFLKEAKEEES